MIRFRFLGRTVALLAALSLCGFFLSGCSGGGLAGELVTGDLIGGKERAKIGISVAATTVGAEGDEISVAISNSDEGEMNWSASLNANWAKIEGDAEGEGSATLTVVFDANADTQERTVLLTIRSPEASNSPQTIKFTQAAAPSPSLGASADNYTLSAQGGRVVVTLENNGGGELDWSASLPSDISWVRLAGKSAGRGEGTVQIEVDANSTTESRSFVLTVSAEGADLSPQTLHFSQEAADSTETEESLEISAANYDLSPEGGSVRVTVAAGASVQWKAGLDGGASWAQISGPAGGTGEGSITIRFDRNADETTRSFVLTVSAEGADLSPQTLHFSQEAADSTETEESLEISAANYDLSPEGGSVRVTVAAGASVQWKAGLDGGASWAQISGPAGGTGEGSITIRFDRNADETTRSFVLTVSAEGADLSPQTLHFSQEAADSTETEESLEISAANYDLSPEGGSVRVTVAAGASVQWKAGLDGGASWAQISGPAGGTGEGSITIRFDRNADETTRSFVLTVSAEGADLSPQTLHFSQEAADSTETEESLEISAANYDLSPEGGSVRVTVAAGASVQWKAGLDGGASWAQISGPAGGTGEGSITIRFDRNADETTRSFVLTVSAEGADLSPQTLHFSQEAADSTETEESLEISAANYDLSPEGGSVRVTVAAGASVQWKAGLDGGASWAQISGPAGGTGEGSITIRFDRNADETTRSFVLTVSAEGADLSPQTLHFSQEAADSTETEESLEISAANYDLSPEGGSVRVTVAAGASVQWKAGLDGGASWAQISGPAGGTGEGSITIRFDRNADETTRSFVLTVSAEGADLSPQTLHFSQEASPPIAFLLTTDSTDRSISHVGGTLRVTVDKSGGGLLNWMASTDVSWAVIKGTSSGTDSGSIVILVSENEGKARSFTVSVEADGTQNSAQSLTFTQPAPPEQPRDSARIRANKYAVSHLGETVTVSIEVLGDDALTWTSEPLQAETHYIVTLPEIDEEGNPTGKTTEETRDRGEWVRVLGSSSGTGSGSLQIQVDENPITARWSFSITITFPDAPKLEQTLHFSQDTATLPQLTLWTATRQIGASGESVEAHLSSSSADLVYWAAAVDVEWAQLGGAIDGEVDGNGTAVIRIEVDPNPGAEERTFTLAVSATHARAPQPIVFRQASAEREVGEFPVPPPPPAWYVNDCQRQTEGFEEFGGWLAQRGYYHNVTDSRVWRYTSDDNDLSVGTLRTFSDCTDNRRTLTTDILADDLLIEPLEFEDLPVSEDARVVLLDITVPAIGDHNTGARHEDPDYVWSNAGSGWYPTYTKDGTGAKFLHVQPLGDWGYGSHSDWQSQLAEWDRDGSDMSAWTDIAQQYGWRLPSIQEQTGEGLRMLINGETSLWLLVGGYTGSGATRSIHPNSAVCGAAKELCLFAPWMYRYTDDEGQAQTAEGTAVAAAQVAAALDNVLVLWPDYDLLALRDLVLGCAEDLGDKGADVMWGHGVLSFNCLFTPQSDLRDPRTGAILSGGIFGPLAGPYGGAEDAPSLAGVSISGVDRTGRSFAYPLMRWSYRENDALLAATAVPNNSDEIPSWELGGFRARSRSATVLQEGSFSARIAASGDALGAVALWRAGGFLARSGLWTFRGGLALQPEGAGSLTGTGVFRPPSTLSSAFSAAFQHNFTPTLSLHVQGQYWMTLSTGTRSLWADAQLAEFRASASLHYQLGRARAILQAQYGGGLRGRLEVAERSIGLLRHSTKQLSLRVRVPLGMQQRRAR